MVITPEIQSKRDEIIFKVIYPGKCWHKFPLGGDDENIKIPGFGWICLNCGRKFNPQNYESLPSYNYGTPGWFDLMKFLVREKPEWWEKFYKWAFIQLPFELDETYHNYLNENLPDLFLRWLVETETGMWERCPNYMHNAGYSPCKLEYADMSNCLECNEEGKILTPLGKLIKEIK